MGVSGSPGGELTEHPTLAVFRLAIVAAGAIVTLWGLRMVVQARGHRDTFLFLTAGFALLTLGAVVEGVLFEFFGWDLTPAHTAEALIAALGFALILISIQRSQI
ncbi:MAG: hypothetical protein ACE5JE_04110 [Thermoplasmata archaeon]